MLVRETSSPAVRFEGNCQGYFISESNDLISKLLAIIARIVKYISNVPYRRYNYKNKYYSPSLLLI